MPAKTLNVALSGMPQMTVAFGGWEIPITLLRISQVISDGWVVNLETPVSFKGTWQPLSPEEINLKPDGQRSWEWIDLHVVGKSVLFKTNDRIIKDGLQYKVMALKDYTLNNFSEYHLIRDYEPVVSDIVNPDDLVTYNGEIVTYLGENVTYTEEAVLYLGEQVTYFGEPVTV